jgi:hypothetical protein
MPLANRFRNIGARKRLIVYHYLVLGKVASVTPSFVRGVAAELQRSAAKP